MAQILFIPFERNKAGNLGSMFKKMQSEGSDPKGLDPNERKFAPPFTNGKYQYTGYFKDLRGPKDQLLINGHGLRGFHKLATEATCKAEGPEVDIPTLILQIEAHGLPENSQAIVKLLACESGLSGNQESFGVAFSRAFNKKWKSCMIYAYRAKLLSQYYDVGERLHKYVPQTPEQRMKNIVGTLEKSKILQPSAKKWPTFWAAALENAGNNKDKAIQDILSGPNRRIFLGANDQYLDATRGDRAKLWRIKLQNGNQLDSEQVV